MEMFHGRHSQALLDLFEIKPTPQDVSSTQSRLFGLRIAFAVEDGLVKLRGFNRRNEPDGRALIPPLANTLTRLDIEGFCSNAADRSSGLIFQP
jgi:hypothetical protein